MPDSLPALSLPETARANPVTALAASPWAPLLAVSGHERIYLYDLAKRAPAGELAFPEGIPYCLRFSRDGAVLLAAGGKGVQLGIVALFDVRTGKRLATLGHEMDIVLAADLSADGKPGGARRPGQDRQSVLGRRWQRTLRNKEAYRLDHRRGVQSRWKAARHRRDRSGGILLWDSARGGNAGALAEHKDSITSLSWRGDSKLLASGSEDGQIVVWNVADGFPLATMSKAHTPKAAPNTYGVIPGGVLGVQFTSDGRIVSAGRDSIILIWSADGAAKSASAKAEALLTKVAASFDGKLFIAGDYRGRVELWDGKRLSYRDRPAADGSR
jgi:WD40 repeat protein